MAEGKVEQTFKLVENETENLTCMDENDSLIEFDTTEEIVRYFIDFRLKYYDKRKALIISKLTDRISYLSNRARFIKMIMDGELKINKRAKADVLADVERLKFSKHNDSYNFLLDMPIHSFTKETYESLLNEVTETKTELDVMKRTEPIDMYRTDLKSLLHSLK
jgi:DNA topoisomerase-2